jgi:hypothetical protein
MRSEVGNKTADQQPHEERALDGGQIPEIAERSKPRASLARFPAR